MKPYGSNSTPENRSILTDPNPDIGDAHCAGSKTSKTGPDRGIVKNKKKKRQTRRIYKKAERRTVKEKIQEDFFDSNT